MTFSSLLEREDAVASLLRSAHGPTADVPRPWHSASDFDGTSSSERLHPTISYADLWTLGGAVAVELLGGPKIRHGLGRTDAPDGKTCPARVVHLRALQGICRGYSTGVIRPSGSAHFTAASVSDENYRYLCWSRG